MFVLKGQLGIFRLSAFLALLLFSQSAPSAAAQDAGDPPAVASFKAYLKAAGHGDADAMLQVALSYQHGWGIYRDDAKAVDWFDKSAAAGNAQGMYQFGLCYELGRGILPDRDQAIAWYTKASAAGETLAHDRLALLRAAVAAATQPAPEPLPADPTRAQDALRLAKVYDSGDGFAQDYPEARRYYQKAAAFG